MIVVDLFREELAFCESNLTDDGIVGLADRLAHVRGPKYRTVLVEEPLVVSKVVRIDCNGCVSHRYSAFDSLHTFEVVAHPRKPLRTWHIADTVAINGDPYGNI